MPKAPRANREHHWELLTVALRLGYAQTLSLEMRIYLELCRDLGDRRAAKMVFADIHEAVKNAMNHFADSCLDCINENNGQMITNIELGMWHLNDARVLTLIPTINCYDSMFDILKGYVIEITNGIDGEKWAACIADSVTLKEDRHKVNKRADALIVVKRATGVRRPPSPTERATLKTLVNDLRTISGRYGRLLDSVRAVSERIPSVKEIRTRHRASRTDRA